MVKYMKEENRDSCPHKVGEPQVDYETCGDCPNRGTIWKKKNGKATIACHFVDREIKVPGFKADYVVSPLDG